MTEKEGGSDGRPSSQQQRCRRGDRWRWTGEKWFSHADAKVLMLLAAARKAPSASRPVSACS